MNSILHQHIHSRLRFATISLLLALMLLPAGVFADVMTPPGPQSGSVGLEATIPSPAPTQAATIATPSNGQTFTTTPVAVNGLCPKGLLVRVFSNNVFVGSTQCESGSYSVQIDLFSGRNDIVTRVYDALDQAGPDSNLVSVTFDDAQFVKYGTRVSLTSDYAKRGANPGDELDWPVILSGGTGPYAMSVDWGDSKAPDLLSQPVPGTVELHHVYDNAGIYKVVVKATDKNGTTAFLQLVGVGNGQVAPSTNTSTNTTATTITKTNVLWWPAVALLPLIGLAFWLGRRHELFSIRSELEQSRNDNV